jgi:hypothetical protein
MIVIAMAYGKEPLLRIPTGSTKRVMYLRNPQHVKDGEPEPMSGVGFPLWAVFQYDSGLFESLKRAWGAGQTTELLRLWDCAMPLARV